jgi:hypothetical protein
MEKMRCRKDMGVYILVWGGFAVLAYCFPYTGDDWMWGTSYGIKLLTTGFAGYNGRYAGNLIVLLLTRCKPLQVLAVSSSLFFLAWEMKQIVNRERRLLFWAAAALLLSLPVEIMREAVVWTSGYSNYVTSALFLLVFLRMAQKLQEENLWILKRDIILCAFLGFINGLFVEHITLVDVLIGLILTAYAWFRNRKMLGLPLAFLAGACLSGILMFQNAAYSNIASGTDTLQRSLFLSYLPMLMLRCRENLSQTILPYGILANWIFYVAGAILAFWIGHEKWPELKKKAKLPFAAAICLLVLFALYSVLLIGNPEWNILADQTEKFEILFTIAYFIAWFCFCLLAFKGKQRERMLFYLFLFAALLAPLFVVTPVGPRCFFCGYVVLMVFLLELFQAACGDSKQDALFQRAIALSVLALFVFWGSIYGYIHLKEKERMQEIRRQITEAGEALPVVDWISLPYNEYLWWADFSDKNEEGRKRIPEFKEFYQISDEVTFRFTDSIQ